MPESHLSNDDISKALEGLENWQVHEGKLRRQFEFANFVEAFGFMSKTALIAEKHDHHPEWFNVYRSLTVDLQTHDAAGGPGITVKDVELARQMDGLL